MAGHDAVSASVTQTVAPAAAAGPATARTASLSVLLRWLPLLVAAAYFAVMMPIGGQMILHYPDERHYAYGGARMVETGDWLIPRTPSGEVRLKKPVIPYWFSAAGFELLGIGVPGFRLFWVIAACGTLLLAHATARALGASPGIALLAELMLAANPVFMRAATNAIPDIPLTFFVAAAGLGFVRLIGTRDTPPAAGWAWVGWLGMALAVLTKGLLPIVLVAALAAYVLVFDRARFGAVFRPLPILAAIAAVAAWYAYAAAAHPDAFAAQFFGDQVTGNATKSAAWILAAFPAYLAVGVLSFLGWPVILGWLALRSKAPLAPRHWPSAARLLALWCAVVVVVFAFSDAVDPRYLLPVMPAFAALLAAGIGALDGGAMPRVSALCRWLLLPVAAIGLILAVPEIVVVLQAGTGVAVVLTVAGAALWVVAALIGRRRPRLAPHVLAATPVLAAAMLALAMAPVVLPDRGVPFAAALAASDIAPAQRAFVGDIHTASEIRLAAGMAEPFVEHRRLGEALDAGSCLVLTTQPATAKRLEEQGFAVDEIRGGWRDMDVQRLFRAIFGWRLAEERIANGAVGYVATCRGTRQ